MARREARLEREPAPITGLLRRWAAGDRVAEEQLLAVVYRDLKKMAAYCLRDERTDHTLQPTALVHEVYLRLAGQRGIHWRNRTQFLALVAKMMRRVLIDSARQHRAEKRGGDRARVTLEEGAVPESKCVDLIALDDALSGLAGHDPLKAKLVELRYFAGLSVTEAAGALGISRATATRWWELARAWLYRELERSR